MDPSHQQGNSAECYSALKARYGENNISDIVFHGFTNGSNTFDVSFNNGNVVIFAIGLSCIYIMEGIYLILYLIDKFQWIGNGTRFPILRQRNPLFSLTSLIGYTFIFIIGPGSFIIGFDQVPCQMTLWLQTLSFPLILFPLTSRILLNYIRIMGSRRVADMFRKTMIAKGLGGKLFQKPNGHSRAASNVSVSGTETKKSHTKTLSVSAAATGLTMPPALLPEISIIAETDGSIQVQRKASDIESTDSKNTDEKKTTHVRNQSTSSGYSNTGKDGTTRAVSISLGGHGGNRSNEARGSLLGELPKKRRLNPKKTSTGLLLSWILTFPYIIAAAIQSGTVDIYSLNCYSCFLLPVDIVGWIVSSVIFVIVASFVLYQMREFPDPFLMKRELVGLLISFIIFASIGIPLVAINPISYNWIVLCLMCVALHSQSIWRAVIYGLIENYQNMSRKLASTAPTAIKGQTQQPVSFADSHRKSKAPMQPRASAVGNGNNEQKYTVEELITTMSHTPLGQLFEKHLIAEHNDENIDFMRNVLLFEQRYDEDEKEYRQKKSKRIYETYIKLGCVSQINISHNQRISLDEKFITSSKQNDETATASKPGQNYVKKNVFRDAKLEIILLIENDSLPRFLNSREYKSFADGQLKEQNIRISIQNSTAISTQ